MTWRLPKLFSYRPGALFRGTVATSTGMAIRLLSQATMLVVVARTLGPADFALFIALFALAVVIGGWVGLGSGYVLLSKAVAGMDALRLAWPVTLRITLASSIAMALVFISVAGLVVGTSQSSALLLAVALTEMLCQPLVYACSFAFQARERIGVSSTLLAIGATLRASGAVLACVLVDDPGVLQVAVGVATGAAGSAVVALLMARRVLGLSLRSAARVDGGSIAQGIPYAAALSSSFALGEVDKVLVLRLLPAELAGVYGATHRLAMALTTPASAFAYTLQPTLFRAAGQGHVDNSWIGKAKLFGATMLLALMSMSGMLAISVVVPSLLGPGFENVAASAALMVPLSGVLCLRIIATQALTALLRTRVRLMIETAGIAAMIAITLTYTRTLDGFIIVITAIEGTAAAAAIFALLLRMREVTMAPCEATRSDPEESA